MKRYYYLTPVLGGPGAPRYPISAESQLIGRSDQAQIALLEPTVSREHAVIHAPDGAVRLQDLDSKHGTYVNSKRITTKQLKVGDIVVFGLSLVLRLEESAEPVPPAPAPPVDRGAGTVDDPPRRRRGTTGGAHREVTHGRGNRAQLELERAHETVVRLHKLAAVGAIVSDKLPECQRRLYELAQGLRHDTISGKRASDALMGVVGTLERVLSDAASGRPQLDLGSLADVVEQALGAARTATRDRSVKTIVDIDQKLSVLTDASRLTNALEQLLRAVFDWAPTGATIQLLATHQDDEHVRLSVGGRLTLPQDAAERLFDPFLTLKDDWSGLGIGLFEARHTLATLGGNLAVEQTQPGTTRFVVLLPRASR